MIHSEVQQNMASRSSTAADIVEVTDVDSVDLSRLESDTFVKLLVLGDLGVGKTSLIRSFVDSDQHVVPDYKVSVEASYLWKSVEIDGRRLHLQLWDIPGHERFGGLTRLYYKYAHGVLLVFDLARPETFETALGWLSDVTEKLFDDRYEPVAQATVKKSKAFSTTGSDSSSSYKPDLDSNKALPVVLLANKSDLPSVKIPRKKYSSYVCENGLLAWYETSARDGSYFGHAVKTLVQYLLHNDPCFMYERCPEAFNTDNLI